MGEENACVSREVRKVWSRGGIISFSFFLLNYYALEYTSRCLSSFADKARDLFTIKLVSKSLTTLCYYYCKLNGLVKKTCVIKSVDEICRSIFIIDRDTRKREYSYSSTSSQWRKEKQKKKKKKKTNLREHHDRIGSKGWREQQGTYPLSIIVQRVVRSNRSVLSPKFSAADSRPTGGKETNRRWYPTDIRLAPVSQRLLGKRTFYRERRGRKGLDRQHRHSARGPKISRKREFRGRGARAPD